MDIQFSAATSSAPSRMPLEDGCASATVSRQITTANVSTPSSRPNSSRAVVLMLVLYACDLLDGDEGAEIEVGVAGRPRRAGR